MSKAKSIQTTKWGTACAQCASAKAKCSRKPTDIPGSKCDRCERLLKTCTDQVHKPRKPRQPRQQKKFSDETSYGGFDSRHASPLIPSSEGSPSTSPAMSMCGSISHPPSPQQWLLNTSPLSLQSSPSEQRNRLLSVPGLYPMYAGEQQQSDEDLLQTYQNELMPRFPFVLVPTEATADDLNMHRPFLMASIRLVASLRNPQYIRGQVGQIMTHFADSIVVRGERNMDLLFGILVLVGWYHYCQIQHSQLNSLLCLTESLIADLGIGQGRRVRDGSDMPSSRNDEQRALLGAWYLRSCVATQFNQLKPTPFTPYIQQCLGEVNRDRNNESDELLVLLVRIQHLTNSISPSSPDHVLSSTWKGLESVIQDAPRELSKDSMFHTRMVHGFLELLVTNRPLSISSSHDSSQRSGSPASKIR
ncbi:transcriptional regulator WAR1 [Rhypophila decipiens]|uniref:Transcriptional regulator WAR1 n=1 Tax=Rhypophila decipiens TaxID=261697 RepID=A0AAN7B2M9_9PEZI|nr:transcriptional regulator WAR1 [Rhypophila decipiens]